MQEGINLVVAEIGIILAVAALCALLARMVKIPLLVGYIGAGLILGPLLVHFGANQNVLQESQRVAFTFLLFLVGLETDWAQARLQLQSGFVVASLQMLGSFGFGFIVAYLFGLSWHIALFLGLCLTFTSGLVALKLLAEQHDLSSLHGRLASSILVVQDLIAIIALTVIQGYAGRYYLTTTQEIAFLIMKGIAVAVIFITASRLLLPKLFKNIAHSSELLLLASLAWCFAGTTLFQLFDLPLEAGALLAGLSLAALPYSIETVSKIRSLRDFFLIFFFINVGITLVVPAPSYIALTIVLITGVTLGRPLITYLSLSLSGYRSRSAFLTSISQGSLSELAIVFAIVGAKTLHVSEQLISAISLTMIVSMCISAVQTMYRQHIYKSLQPVLRLTERGHHRHIHLITGNQLEELHDHVVIFGYHRMGYPILQQLLKHNQPVLVVDFNPDVINKLRNSDIKAIYGDIEDEQIFYTSGVAKASMVISTIPRRSETDFLLKMVKELNPKAQIIVTAKTVDDALHYYQHHASYVLVPHLLGSEHVAQLLQHQRQGTITTLAAKQAEELKLLQTSHNALFSD